MSLLVVKKEEKEKNRIFSGFFTSMSTFPFSLLKGAHRKTLPKP
jgi:hypothetical protein